MKKIEKIIIPKHNERSTSIEAFRAIATLSIAIFHFEIYFPIVDGGLFNTGYLSVEFFFILSGFFLCKELLFILRKDEKIEIKVIMRKKICRLYGPYIISLLCLGELYAFKWYNGNFFEWLTSQDNWIVSFVTQVLCIQCLGFTSMSDYTIMNGPTWYVSALLLGTIIIGMLFKYVSYNFLKISSWVIAIGLYIILFLFDFTMNPQGILLGIFPTAMIRAMAGIFLGVAVVELFERIKSKINKISFFYISIIEFILTGLYLFLIIQSEASCYNYFIIPVSVGIILFMFQSRGIISCIFKYRIVQMFGKISFSFYVIQSFCSNIFTCFFPSIKQPYAIIMYLILNLFMGILLYIFVEKPSRKFLFKKK